MIWKCILIALALLTDCGTAAITKDPGPIPELRPPRSELAPNVETKPDLRPWFIGTGIIAVLAAVLASIPRRQTPPPPPPYVVARKKLDTLGGTGANADELIRVFRDYLLDAFNIPARGATTAELLHWLSAHPRWDTQLEPETTALLDSCDEAKFSPVPPPQSPISTEGVLALISRIEGRRTLAGGISQPAVQS
jgi:hypothetical protein